jgi:hypothetical protein
MPDIGFGIVDVADISAMHLAALEGPQSIGHRFIGSNGTMTMPRIAKHLAARIPTGKIATRIAPKPFCGSCRCSIRRSALSWCHRHGADSSTTPARARCWGSTSPRPLAAIDKAADAVLAKAKDGAMRAFLALPIPMPRSRPLSRTGAHPGGTPVPEDNLHLTLAFLGDVNEAVLEDARRDPVGDAPAHRAGRLRRARHFRRDGTRPGLCGGAPDPGLPPCSPRWRGSRAWRGPSCRVGGSGPMSRWSRPTGSPWARARPAGRRARPAVRHPGFRRGRIGPQSVHADPGGARHDPLALSPVPDSPPEPAARSGRRAVAAPRAGPCPRATGRGVRDRKCPVVRSPDRSSSGEADGAPVRQGGKGSRRSAQSPAPARDTARPVRGET